MTAIDPDPLPGRDAVLALCLARNGEIVVPHLEVACTFFSRLMGLQFRRPLPRGHGLLLVPCSSIHTICLRFAISAIMLDGTGTVRRVVENLRPYSAALAPRGTRAVLELTAGTGTIAVGEQVRLVIRGQPSRHLPRRLSFLSIKRLGDDAASKGNL